MFSTSRRRLSAALQRRVDSYEANHADPTGPLVVAPSSTTLMAAQGNPAFDAQFDITFNLVYFTVAAGVFTSIAAAALNGTLKGKLPFFLFGQSDFAGGFAKLRQQYPLLGGWTYGTPFIYGSGATPTVDEDGTAVTLTGTALATVAVGDLVIPFTATVAGTSYVALSVVHCTQVAYGTLLDSISSDLFQIVMLRYIMNDTTAVGVAQFVNQIGVYDQSLFGKFKSDTISPNSYKLPEQMQTGIIDIPLVQGVTKQVSLASPQNYDAISVQWSIFVGRIAKPTF